MIDSLQVATAAATFIIMTVVGLDLTGADFRRVLSRPAPAAAGMAGQWILLPLAVWVVTLLLPLPPHIVAGMVILAGSPGGAISNYYAFLARADTALSVSLTALTGLASIITMPLIAKAGFALLLGADAEVTAPFGVIVSRLLVGVLIPVSIGMLLRRRFPEWITGHMRGINWASIGALFILLALLLSDLGASMTRDLGVTVLAALIYTALGLLAGWTIGFLAKADGRERFTLMTEYACRNLAVTALIGVTVLDRPDFLVFGIAFFLAQIPLMLGAVAVFRWR